MQREQGNYASVGLGAALGAARYPQDCPAPNSQSPLSAVIDTLRRKTGSLEQLFEAMQVKLGPVLVSVPEQPEKCGSGITGPQSAITMELSEIEYRLGVLCRKIDVLLTRIEV